MGKRIRKGRRKMPILQAKECGQQFHSFEIWLKFP